MVQRGGTRSSASGGPGSISGNVKSDLRLALLRYKSCGGFNADSNHVTFYCIHCHGSGGYVSTNSVEIIVPVCCITNICLRTM